MSGASVVCDHLRKSFEGGRVRALEDVSFDVEPGQLIALTGPSGCGKSTLLNLIGALDRPDGGSVSVDGEDLATIPHPGRYRAQTIGFVFQLHNLIPTLTAAENVQVPMLGQGVGRHERQEKAQALLAEVGLAGRIEARPGVLSGGERQRVAIARALANDPRLLLADEPTAALDYDSGMQVIDLLQDVRERRGTTVLVVTNDEEVARRADRILRLRDGVIRAEEPRSVSA